MNMPIPFLGSWLEDPTISTSVKCETVFGVLGNVGAHPYHAAGKGCCWLAYRHLEGVVFCPNLSDLIESAVIRTQAEDAPRDQAARWFGSLLAVKAYVEIMTSKFDEAEKSLKRIGDEAAMERIRQNPTCAVNVCRAMSLLAAYHYGSKAGEVWMDRAIELFREAVAHWKLKDVPFCAGHELVAAARAVGICVQLAPALLSKFQGAIMNLGDIIGVEPEGFYRSALERMIYRKQ